MPENRNITARDLWSFRFVGDPQVSPSANQAAYTLTEIDGDKNGYRTSLWLVGLAEGAVARRITNFDRPDALIRDLSPRWSPDGTSLAFLSNRSGRNQIWLLPMDAGEAHKITDMQDPVSEICWSPDGKKIAFCCRQSVSKDDENPDLRVVTRLRYKANGTGFTDDRPRHIHAVEVETGAVTQLTFGDYEEFSPAWSPDGNKIAFLSCRRSDCELKYYPDVWVMHLQSGKDECLTRGLGPCSAPVWSHRGDMIAYFGTEKGEASAPNSELWVSRLDAEPMSLTQNFDRSVGSGVGSDSRYDQASGRAVWSADDSELYFLAADGGKTSIFGVCVEKPQTTEHIGAPGLNIASFDAVAAKDGMCFAYNAGMQTNPGDIYTGRVPLRLTRSNDDLFSTIRLVDHERVVYEGDKGWPIEAWIMKPAGFVAGKKYPVVVQIHGGPASTVGEGFFHEYQLLAARGYGVFYMNFRGSRGYGEEFAQAIVGDWGGGEYRDIMRGADYLATLDWVDTERLFVTGGSFGGYETNWIICHDHRFRAAVTQRSISNMYTKYGVSDIGWYGNKAGMGGADLWDSEDFIMSRSPIRYAPNVKTPLLIIHSEEDLRCPMEQAEQWYVALKRLGNTEVEFVRFARENHELSRSGRPLNRLARLERIVDWFDRHK